MASSMNLFYAVCFACFITIDSAIYRTASLPENCQWNGRAVSCKYSLPDFSPYNPIDLAKIYTIHITDCEPTILGNDSFTGLSNLRVLDIDCKLLDVEPGAFNALNKLNLLSLKHDGASLPDGLFCGLPSLTSLLLQRNSLTSNTTLGFHSQCVGDLVSCGSNITYLSIENNDLAEIKSGLLCNLPNLQVFNASNNQISLIEPLAFSNSIHLQNLYLGNNSLSALDPATFQNTTDLTVLDLSFNKLTTIPSTLLKNLTVLRSLNLRGNKLEMINRNAFVNLSSLTDLDLAYNSLSKLDSTLFYLTKLATLSLNGNKLKELSSSTLLGLINLNHLKLDDNNIKQFDKNALKFNPKLTVLSVNNNNLKALPNLMYTTHLFALHASNNSITTLSETAFQNSTNVFFLDFSANKLGSINNQTFANMTYLLKLDLSNNSIKSIDDASFSSLAGLKFLYLQSNNLTFEENANAEYENMGLFTPLTSLLLMNLSSNAISKFSYTWFPAHLIYLSLTNNSISTLPIYDKLVDPTPHLHTLDLSSNSIENITAFQLPPSLTNVILSTNKIQNIGQNAFSDMTNLEYLFLRGNSLMALPVLNMGSTLTTVTLRDNPWLCDCKLNWLKDTNRLPYMVYDALALKCQTLFNKTYSDTIRLVTSEEDDFLCSFKQDPSDKTKCVSSSTSKGCLYHCPANCTCYHDITWKIVKIDCTSANLQKVPEDFPRVTDTYYLDGNSINSVSSTALQNAQSLKEIYLNASKIGTVEDGSFAFTFSLEVLHLDHNLLETLPSTIFKNLTKMQYLDLSFNNLDSLHERLFSPLQSLQVLKLQNNKLTNFPVWAFSDTPSITALSLYDNPWDCGCDYASKYREWLQSHIEKLRNISRLHCTMVTSSGPMNVSLTLFNSTHCYHPLNASPSVDSGGHSTAVVAVSVCISIVALVAGILAFIYRSELKLSIERKFGVRLI